MLQEYLKYLTAKASDYARDLGYLKESIAFEARAQRAQSLWNDHFRRCQEEVLLRTEDLPPGSTIWILGSGSLYETPWQELIGKSHFLKLVDIYHPPIVKSIAKTYPRIELVEHDLSGFQNLPMLKKILLKVPQPLPLPIQPRDFVVSSNIWSQLPIFPIEFLEKNTEVSQEEKIQWARSLQKNHGEWLLSLGANGIIISDFETHHLNFKGEIVKIEQQPCRPQTLERISMWNWRWSKNIIRKMEVYSIARNT
jgi:hypothetical protein